MASCAASEPGSHGGGDNAATVWGEKIRRVPSASEPPPAVLQDENSGHACEQRKRQAAAKCKAEKSGMRSDQPQNHEHYSPCARVRFVTFHCHTVGTASTN